MKRVKIQQEKEKAEKNTYEEGDFEWEEENLRRKNEGKEMKNVYDKRKR
jgi:hypothetical protein